MVDSQGRKQGAGSERRKAVKILGLTWWCGVFCRNRRRARGFSESLKLVSRPTTRLDRKRWCTS